MGRPIRQFKSDAIYLVTNRCHQARFFFRPSKEVNDIILSVLAYVADRYEVEIFAFVFMSNHFHMLVRAKLMNLNNFMRDFQSQVAKRLNTHWNREGKVFGGRYVPTEILDDKMLLEKLCYILCNPCLSNLVSHPKLWPGLSSWSIHKTGEPLVGKRVDSQEFWRLKRKHPEMSDREAAKRATSEYSLQMAKLPAWKHHQDREYRRKLCSVVEEYARQLAQKRAVPCLGREKVLRQHFNERPTKPKKSPRPVCLSSCPKLKKEFVDHFREVIDRYKEAVGRLRQGKRKVRFPHGTIPPGHILCVGAPRPRDTLEAA